MSVINVLNTMYICCISYDNGQFWAITISPIKYARQRRMVWIWRLFCECYFQ